MFGHRMLRWQIEEHLFGLFPLSCFQEERLITLFRTNIKDLPIHRIAL